jgi:hypothetical protein
MKRFLCLALFLCFILPNFAAAESMNPVLTDSLTLNAGESVLHFCADDNGGFFVLSRDSIYHWNDNIYDEKYVKFDNDCDIVGICFYRGVLYGITGSHTLMQCYENGFTVLGQNEEAEEPVFFCKVTAADGMVFYTYKNIGDTYNNIALYSFDIADGAAQEWPAFDGVEIYADEKQHCIYHLSSAKLGALYAINIKGEKEIIKINDGSSVPAFLNSYYEPCSNTFYITNRDGIYRWNTKGEAELFWEGKGLSRIIPMSDGRIAVVETSNVYVYSSGSHKSSSINVLGFQSVYERQFTNKTGINVNEVDRLYNSMAEEIATRLLSRDSNVDIFAVWSDDGFSAIKEKGYYTDLSQSSVLENASHELFPAFKAVITDGKSKIAAWPFFSYTHLMAEDKELLESYGFKAPANFSELLDPFPKILQSGLLEDNDYIMFDTISCCRSDLLRLFVRQYIREAQMRGETPLFNDPAFLDTANRILDEMPEQDPVPRGEEGEESPLFILDNINNRLDEETHAPLAACAKSHPAVEVQLLLLFVNPYSNNKSEAIKYLEFLSNKRTTEDYALFATMTEPAIDPAINKKYRETCQELKKEKALEKAEPDVPMHKEKILALQEEAEYLQKQQVIVSKKAIENYHSLSPYFVVMQNEDIAKSQGMNTLLSRLLDSNMSLNTFAQSADEYFRMVIAED